MVKKVNFRKMIYQVRQHISVRDGIQNHSDYRKVHFAKGLVLQSSIYLNTAYISLYSYHYLHACLRRSRSSDLYTESNIETHTIWVEEMMPLNGYSVHMQTYITQNSIQNLLLKQQLTCKLLFVLLCNVFTEF